MSKLIITICSSADFYRKVIALQTILEKHGYHVIVPLTATRMKASGDYDASHYRLWLKDEDHYPKKTALIREHFREVERADVVLVVNETKHGQANYIGGNVLLEMGLGFYLGKPIYVLNDIPKESNHREEIIALGAKPLKGDMSALLAALKKIRPASSE